MPLSNVIQAGSDSATSSPVSSALVYAQHSVFDAGTTALLLGSASILALIGASFVLRRTKTLIV